MKTILVTGSSGFIGTHLVKRLKDQGHFVVGADIEPPKYEKPHVFFHYDLRIEPLCHKIFNPNRITDSYEKIDEVYNLACLMGGMGYIGDSKHNYDIMMGSSQIVINILECCIQYGATKLFYSSSACVYNMNLQDTTDNISLKESTAYPAMPDLVYGWQKLFSEQLHQACMDKLDIRIARFHNIYGPYGSYNNGKEKAPAALCRKAIECKGECAVVRGICEDCVSREWCDHTSIEVWGDGNQTRSFLYIDDCLDAVELLMRSDFKEPINIGSEESVTITQLAELAIEFSGKNISIVYDASKPQGVRGRNSENTLIEKVLGWKPKYSLRQGMGITFSWIREQINGL